MGYDSKYREVKIMKLSTMCLNKLALNCGSCQSNYELTYQKCIILADRKMRQLETQAKELYCDHIDLIFIIEELQENDQELYHELRRFIDGEN